MPVVCPIAAPPGRRTADDAPNADPAHAAGTVVRRLHAHGTDHDGAGRVDQRRRHGYAAAIEVCALQAATPPVPAPGSDMHTSSFATNAMSADELHYLQKELYELLRDGPDIFDFIQGGSLDGIWYWDLENPTEEWMSERFWTTLGYDRAGKPHKADAWQDIIFMDDLATALENFEKHRADATPPYDQIVRYRHRDGSTVWIRCRGLALRDEEGRPLRMLGAHTDITALKVAEEQLALKNLELEAANQSLARFAYAASHDLQSPIKSLNGVLDVLAEDHADQLDPTGLHVLSVAADADRRVESLTSAILDYSKTGTADEGHQAVDCGALMEDIRTNLAADLERYGVTLECGPLPVIRAVPSPTRQLSQNLVGNAIKFRTKERGTSPRVVVRVNA